MTSLNSAVAFRLYTLNTRLTNPIVRRIVEQSQAYSLSGSFTFKKINKHMQHCWYCVSEPVQRN